MRTLIPIAVWSLAVCSSSAKIFNSENNNNERKTSMQSLTGLERPVGQRQDLQMNNNNGYPNMIGSSGSFRSIYDRNDRNERNGRSDYYGDRRSAYREGRSSSRNMRQRDGYNGRGGYSNREGYNNRDFNNKFTDDVNNMFGKIKREFQEVPQFSPEQIKQMRPIISTVVKQMITTDGHINDFGKEIMAASGLSERANGHPGLLSALEGKTIGVDMATGDFTAPVQDGLKEINIASKSPEDLISYIMSNNMVNENVMAKLEPVIASALLMTSLSGEPATNQVIPPAASEGERVFLDSMADQDPSLASKANHENPMYSMMVGPFVSNGYLTVAGQSMMTATGLDRIAAGNADMQSAMKGGAPLIDMSTGYLTAPIRDGLRAKGINATYLEDLVAKAINGDFIYANLPSVDDVMSGNYNPSGMRRSLSGEEEYKRRHDGEQTNDNDVHQTHTRHGSATYQIHHNSGQDMKRDSIRQMAASPSGDYISIDPAELAAMRPMMDLVAKKLISDSGYLNDVGMGIFTSSQFINERAKSVPALANVLSGKSPIVEKGTLKFTPELIAALKKDGYEIQYPVDLIEKVWSEGKMETGTVQKLEPIIASVMMQSMSSVGQSLSEQRGQKNLQDEMNRQNPMYHSLVSSFVTPDGYLSPTARDMINMVGLNSIADGQPELAAALNGQAPAVDTSTGQLTPIVQQELAAQGWPGQYPEDLIDLSLKNGMLPDGLDLGALGMGGGMGSMGSVGGLPGFDMGVESPFGSFGRLLAALSANETATLAETELRLSQAFDTVRSRVVESLDVVSELKAHGVDVSNHENPLFNALVKQYTTSEGYLNPDLVTAMNRFGTDNDDSMRGQILKAVRKIAENKIIDPTTGKFTPEVKSEVDKFLPTQNIVYPEDVFDMIGRSRMGRMKPSTTDSTNSQSADGGSSLMAALDRYYSTRRLEDRYNPFDLRVQNTPQNTPYQAAQTYQGTNPVLPGVPAVSDLWTDSVNNMNNMNNQIRNYYTRANSDFYGRMAELQKQLSVPSPIWPAAAQPFPTIPTIPNYALSPSQASFAPQQQPLSGGTGNVVNGVPVRLPERTVPRQLFEEGRRSEDSFSGPSMFGNSRENGIGGSEMRHGSEMGPGSEREHPRFEQQNGQFGSGLGMNPLDGLLQGSAPFRMLQDNSALENLEQFNQQMRDQWDSFVRQNQEIMNSANLNSLIPTTAPTAVDPSAALLKSITDQNAKAVAQMQKDARDAMDRLNANLNNPLGNNNLANPLGSSLTNPLGINNNPLTGVNGALNPLNPTAINSPFNTLNPTNILSPAANLFASALEPGLLTARITAAANGLRRRLEANDKAVVDQYVSGSISPEAVQKFEDAVKKARDEIFGKANITATANTAQAMVNGTSVDQNKTPTVNKASAYQSPVVSKQPGTAATGGSSLDEIQRMRSRLSELETMVTNSPSSQNVPNVKPTGSAPNLSSAPVVPTAPSSRLTPVQQAMKMMPQSVQNMLQFGSNTQQQSNPAYQQQQQQQPNPAYQAGGSSVGPINVPDRQSMDPTGPLATLLKSNTDVLEQILATERESMRNFIARSQQENANGLGQYLNRAPAAAQSNMANGNAPSQPIWPGMNNFLNNPTGANTPVGMVERNANNIFGLMASPFQAALQAGANPYQNFMAGNNRQLSETEPQVESPGVDVRESGVLEFESADHSGQETL